ncbi:MAG: hypothetical protein LUD15_12115 [Bacteroides sp.]|nr:hypothetical protein [Bacteroides sp.]
MKKIIYILYSCTLAFMAACTNEQAVDRSQESLYIQGIKILLGETDSDVVSRALSDYSVNQSNDPTGTLTGRETWNLDVTIYDGTNAYRSQTFTWDSTEEYWVGDTLFFPNYTRQLVEAKLSAPGWSEIRTDQRILSDFLEQDVLIQNGEVYITVYPGHDPEIPMKHAHTILDFRINGIDPAQLDSVIILIGDTAYLPYQVVSGTVPEYIVIIPPGTTSPTVRLVTTEATRYLQTTVGEITNTDVNGCYCFILNGMQLELGEITVINWITGLGIPGEYTTEETYPTFRGPANRTYTVTYDNGLSQEIILNDQGEYTARPAGRAIVSVSYQDKILEIDPPYVLSGMIIDLYSYFSRFDLL